MDRGMVVFRVPEVIYRGLWRQTFAMMAEARTNCKTLNRGTPITTTVSLSVAVRLISHRFLDPFRAVFLLPVGEGRCPTCEFCHFYGGVPHERFGQAVGLA